MNCVSAFKFVPSGVLLPCAQANLHISSSNASFTHRWRSFASSSPIRRKTLTLVSAKSSEAEEISDTEDEWLKKLPEKNKPLYSHSLPCIEAWLRKLGFYQSKDDRAVWLIQKPDWHAQLSLDVTDLCIRYLKSGPGNLERDMERRFSYALSREDTENAILGGP
ncbi:hypothetical protein Bca4012_044518 [Brassica carinata]|uniref:BnaC09g29030D protein n=5 Tax=Brassica TaxID=3705 RepID=A0A078G3R9_BRANA|nr:PREDICTED: uncharacterized protein LOC106315663 [Brassica oleracea var. oleracea]XP_013709592.1 uncharacterized protein BNAC09G29030D isoform X1 [Brassica napus]KAF2538464.1 hypothetical protein F2Q68_00021531 [Brassica cretica]VDD31821.1 unnamed protein product [Brassica oleracea]KAH0859292.1 hypothetical protein HID58_087553 [Brassica napus]CAF1756199.1 unnamed protein product [Brassica napus]CDY19647.1 BnaC09g29030D [Brassica napus]